MVQTTPTMCLYGADRDNFTVTRIRSSVEFIDCLRDVWLLRDYVPSIWRTGNHTHMRHSIFRYRSMVHIGMYYVLMFHQTHGSSEREIQVKIKISEENIFQGFLLIPVDS